jgi:Tol biopolymer transport system component
MAFPGSLALPFPKGETWYICQGYLSGSKNTHSYSYALDLTAGSPCNKTAATGRAARAPAAGNVSRYENKTGTLCINMTGGGSVVVTHIIAETHIILSLKKKVPVPVTAGEQVGTVAEPGKVKNNGMAHIHLEVSSKRDCPWIRPADGHSYLSGTTPFDDAHGTRLECAPDLPAGGPIGTAGQGQWSGTALVNTCTTEGSPPGSVATGDVVFVRFIAGDAHIFRHRASDNTDVDLFGDAYTEGQPDVSPDGSRIAFVKNPSTGCYGECIFVMNSDGTAVTQITAHTSSTQANDWFPRWSPDGQWLIFVRAEVGTPPYPKDVYKIRADGSGLAQLTTHGAAEQVASWSPDGTKVAYDRNEGGYGQVYIVGDDGTNDHRVMSASSGYQDRNPAWSPDGNRIYFASTESGNGDLTGLMYFSHPNGFVDQTGVSRTTLTSPSLGLTDETPRVGGDGNTVYFGSTRDVWEHIYKIANVGGSWGAPTAVTSGDQNDAYPSPVNR